MMHHFFPFTEHNQAHTLYALVDCALTEGFYTDLAQADQLSYKSLFSGTIDASSAAVGPVLLSLQSDSHAELIEKLVKLQTQYPTPIWLQTEITFTPLFNTLRKLLYIEREDGSQHFFRYYDHACLSVFISIIYNDPSYAYTMREINWAIWSQEKGSYQYYDKDNLRGRG